jgi:4-amino-4-deoxy-L-arabinose transferase-like glycosyltransferase
MTSVAKQTGRLEMRDLIILTVLVCLFFTFMLENRPLSVPDEGRYVEIPRRWWPRELPYPRLNGVKYFEKPVSSTGSRLSRSNSSG